MANVTLMSQRVLAQMKGTFELDSTEKLGRDAEFLILSAGYSYALMIASGSF